LTDAHAGVRAELLRRLRELRDTSTQTKQDRAPVELDQTSVGRLSRVDALQQQAMAQATEKRRHEESKRIEAALQRLDAGEYGYCGQCGDAIAAARLDLDPATATCIRCARSGV
jgi:DnaK suppressor protein